VLKVAIIGCGKIADDHANHIARLPDCTMVGFCDRELLMAKQMQERYGGVPAFDDIGALLAHAHPDVVHITTPPQSHFELARRCLLAGCHVYVEKPFTVTAAEASELVALASMTKLKVTVGHNYMFSEPARRMRELVREGYLGGAPVHIESYYGYDLGDLAYAQAFLGDRQHWLRQLPGGLFQNIISHGICRIAEYIGSEPPRVVAHAFQSPLLQQSGQSDIQDELRVMVQAGSTSAFFVFSTQMRPQLSELRIYGPRNALILLDHQHTLLKLPGGRYKSYMQYLVPPVAMASQYLRETVGNLRELVTGRLHLNDGLRMLIEQFYRSITHGDDPPIPMSEIVLTAEIMDRIFETVGGASAAPGRSMADAMR